MTRLFKVLDGRTPPIAGTAYRYPVGRWTEHLDPDTLRRCRVGYHVVPGEYLLGRLGHPDIYEATPCPDHEPLDFDTEVVTCRVRLRRLRWDETIARMFAADCAEAALLGEQACGREPEQPLWHAVEVARRYARGEADREALTAARYAAADIAYAHASDVAAVKAAPPADDYDAAADAAAHAAHAVTADATVYAAHAAAAAADYASYAAAASGAYAVPRSMLFRRLETYLDGLDPGPIEALYRPRQ